MQHYLTSHEYERIAQGWCPRCCRKSIRTDPFLHGRWASAIVYCASCKWELAPRTDLYEPLILENHLGQIAQHALVRLALLRRAVVDFDILHDAVLSHVSRGRNVEAGMLRTNVVDGDSFQSTWRGIEAAAGPSLSASFRRLLESARLPRLQVLSIFGGPYEKY